MGIKTNAAKTVPEGAVAIVAYFPGLVSWVTLLSVTTEYFFLEDVDVFQAIRTPATSFASAS